MRKFEFQNAFEEVEVGGKVYRIDFSDEKLKAYRKEFQQFQKDIIQLQKVIESNLSEDEQFKHFEDMKTIVKNVLETIIGDNSFDSIYEASGHSLMNTMDFIYYLADIVKEKSTRNVEDKRKKYLKGAKK